MQASVSRKAALWCVLLLLQACGAAYADEWRYLVPTTGQPDEHAPLRALALRDGKPEDLKEQASYRGTRRQYGQFRYGSATSVRVAVVLDRVSAKEFDLYVDANRDRSIDDLERLFSEDRAWRVPLDLAISEDSGTRTIGRQVVFRLGKTGRIFSYATLGYLEGTVDFDGERLSVRRQDGDGNGLVNDPQDRLWFDLNDNGERDALTEQFLFAAILKLGEQRYSVASDRVGQELTLRPLVGEGTLRLAYTPPGDGDLLEITATLNGRDGSAVSLSGDAAETVVPAGEYRLGSVSVKLADPSGGESWNFVFDENGGRVADEQGRLIRPWYKIEAGDEVEIDPIGKAVLALDTSKGGPEYRPGDSVTVQPLLYTGEGLLITSCSRGDADESGTSASVSLTMPDGAPLATTSTGFS